MIERVAETVQGLISTIGTTCYVGDFPGLSAEGVSVRLESGEDASRHFGSVDTSIFRPSVVVTARSASYNTARGWLTSIRDIIDGYTNGATLGIYMQGTATYLGRDDQKMHEFQVYYKTLVKE